MVKQSAEKWYIMPVGQWCGVFIREEATGQLQEILNKHAKEISDYLTAHMDALLPHRWTLAYPNGKQEVVYYAITGDQEYELCNTIGLFERNCELKRIDGGVYLSDNKSLVEAESEIAKYYTELHSGV